MKSANILKGLVLASLLILPSASALAQQNPAGAQGGQRGGGRGGQRGGGRGASLVTAPIASLKSALQLTEDQATKIEAIQKKAISDSAALRQAQQGQQPTPEAQTQMRELRTKATSDIEAVLTDAQKPKVAPLLKEWSAYASVGIPLSTLDALKLTDDQKKQITAIADKAQKDTAALAPEDRRTKGREIRTASREEVAKLLTDDQKKEIEKARAANPQRQRGAGNPNP